MTSPKMLNSGLLGSVIFCLLWASFCTASYPPDVQSLYDLRSSLVKQRDNIPNWFDFNISPCNWSGISCEDSIVQEVDLSLPLNLPFPARIAEFTNLRYLNLSHCALTGQLPMNFWRLSRLETLDLSGNMLTGSLPLAISGLKMIQTLVLDDNEFSGSLPPSIGLLGELVELSVHGNSLSGILPPEIGNLSKLESLDLGSNNFSGNLPSTLGNLQQLSSFDASQNRFSGSIFPEIGNLVGMHIIDLSWNSLSGPIPTEIGKLVNLHSLILGNNNFNGALPAALGDLTSLEVLNLQSCRFSGTITREISRLANLTLLNIEHNMFEGELPAGLGNLTDLTFFLASDSGLSGRIPEELGRCKSLQVLDLSLNSFSGPLPDDLVGMESVRSVMLNSNQLSGPIPLWMSKWVQAESIMLSQNLFNGSLPPLNWKSLALLDVSSNTLSGELSPQICDAKPLRRLVLSGNSFTGTIDTTFRNCVNLTDLILSGNNLSGEIPGYLGELHLITLELSKNKFSGKIPDELYASTTLLEVSLADNELKGELPEAIGKVLSLQRLQLDKNFFEGRIPASIGELRNLTNLSLRGNLLTGEIPLELFKCTRLVSLDLGSNRLRGRIPKSISELKLLDNLVLSGNRLSGTIPKEICSGFQKVPLPDSEFVQHYGMLDLSDNEFIGPIPSAISKCIVVTQLFLQRNHLSGEIPPVSSLSSLTSIDLSFNRLSGNPFPSFSSLGNLQGLVLSHNQLTGSIPDEMASMMPILTKLDLSQNRLSGILPPCLLSMKSLSYVDISSNFFTGPIPCDSQGLSFVDSSGKRFSGFVPETCSNNAAETSPVSAPRGLSKSVRGILIISSSVFILLVICLLIARNLSKPRAPPSVDDNLIISVGADSSDELLGKKLKEPLSINIATFQHSLTKIHPSDILSATENFSKSYVIGDGGFGTVYRAALPEGRTMAVKRLNNGGLHHGNREFLAEMETIGKVRHENLVPLIGYCVFDDERFLIYEYMENGSLDVWLRSRADAVEVLDWPTRFNILSGAARGIAFLHHGFVPHIIHRDIKSSNILLDSKFEAKVSDFGLARIISACESHVSTVLAGTFGYIPPEYGQCMTATTNGDVYSFGVVMLELVTGKAPTGQADVEGGNLVGWVRQMVAKRREEEVLDSCFGGSAKWKGEMLGVLGVARMCTGDDPRRRPSMVEVVKMLGEIKIGN